VIHAVRTELRKLYSRWATLSPYPLIALTLGLVAWNVSKLGGPIGLAPEAGIVTFFPLLMWWLLGAFAVVAAAGSLGGEFELGTARTTLVTPVSRGRFLLAKFIACVVHVLCLVVFTAGLSQLVRWALFDDLRFGLLAGTEGAYDLLRPEQHPVEVLSGAGAWVRLALCYGYTACFLVALTALSLLVAAMMRHTVGAISVTAAIAVLEWVVSSVEPLAHVRPFMLVDQARGWLWVASGIVPVERVLAGLASMTGYTVACLVCAWVSLARRDVHA